MYIPLELNGIIKKTEFKIICYNSIYNKIEENTAHIDLYKYKDNKPFEKE